MLKRDSKFPSASRRTYTRSSGYREQDQQRRSGIFPVLFILALAAGFYVYQMPGRPLDPYLDQLKHFLSDRNGAGIPPVQRTAPATPKRPEPRMRTQSRPVPSKAQAPIKAQTSSPDLDGQTSARPTQLNVSIGLGFRPAGFRIGAVSRSITLSDLPGKNIHRLPRFDAPKQRYGVIRLANGREHGFALEMAASGYRLFFDHNRNGDLRDDGEPLLNQGKGLFASKILLPLAQVSGIPELQGDYTLWLFTNPGNWKRHKMLFYSMTQLQGELLLKGKRYTAYLADNGPVDGDYRNDGISIDLNGDGKIDRRSERFPPGKTALINGQAYSFRITR